MELSSYLQVIGRAKAAVLEGIDKDGDTAVDTLSQTFNSAAERELFKWCITQADAIPNAHDRIEAKEPKRAA